MITRRCLTVALMCTAIPALAASTSNANDTAPADDTVEAANITGSWAGEGFVQKDERSKKVNVKCTVDGEQYDNVISFDGSCRAMLIMKRAIGADLIRTGDSYSGTYKGADAGIAELDGTRTDADKLVLQMTFPRKVHTDDLAEMIIEHPNADAFTITTTDQMVSGVEVVTSQIAFIRQDSVAKK